MEVSGRKDNTSSQDRGSSGSSGGLVCQPCIADGENLEADGFCQNCQEYLCRTCIRYHRKATLSKHHVILDKDKMPQNVVPEGKTKHICTETCDKHIQEVIKFFCRDHGTVGCGNCMIFGHKACKVDFIPDIADDFVNGQEYKVLFINIEQLRCKVGSMEASVKDKKQIVCNEHASAIEEIRKFRKEIEVHLDEMERGIIAECDRVKKEQDEDIKNMEDDLKSFKSELDRISDCLTSKLKQTGDLFVQVKQTGLRLNQLEQEVTQTSKITLKLYEFMRDEDIEDIVSRKGQLGKLMSKTFQDSKTIDLLEVKLHNDLKSAYIVIRGKVYDVTEFVDEHPGGEAVLLDFAGGDATAAFEDVGHSADARELLKDYYIGDLSK